MLKDFADVVMGQSPAGDAVSVDKIGLPLLNGPTEFGSHHPVPVQFTSDARKIARQGDLLFCVRGSTTGRMNWADQDYAIGRGIAAIRPNDPRLAPAIRAFVELGLPSLLAAATGSTFPNVSRDQIRSIPTMFSDMESILSASRFLTAIDDKIETNRRMNHTMEGIARELFKSWFVSFDPVRANAEGRSTGLSSDLASLFPASFGDDETPHGWAWGPLSSLVANVIERCHPSSTTERRPYVPIDAIAAKSVVLPSYRPGSEAQSSLVTFQAGDVLFGAMRPYFHKVALAPFEGTTRTTVFVLRPLQEADREFALSTLSAEETVAYATAHSAGSTIPYAVWGNSMDRMPAMLATPEIRAAYGDLVRPLIQRAILAAEQSRTLAALRDLLLPKLMSGSVRVKDAEAMLEQIA